MIIFPISFSYYILQCNYFFLPTILIIIPSIVPITIGKICATSKKLNFFTTITHIAPVETKMYTISRSIKIIIFICLPSAFLMYNHILQYFYFKQNTCYHMSPIIYLSFILFFPYSVIFIHKIFPLLLPYW